MHDKVFWSAAEKKLIVQSAIEIQHRRPDLAGLPLLREAMKSLPPDRRRRLVSLSQVDWFETAVETEANRQAAEAKPAVQPTMIVYPSNMDGNPYVPFFREIAEACKHTEASVRRLAELQERMIRELASLRELLQERLGRVKPSSRPARPSRATNDQVRLSRKADT